MLLSRIVIYSAGIAIILELWGLPAEWFIGVSALSGAAIGFASTQTIGNLLAGFCIMVTRPFEVDDYVKIGGSEGGGERDNFELRENLHSHIHDN